MSVTQQEIINDAIICQKGFPGGTGYAPDRDRYILAASRVVAAARELEQNWKMGGVLVGADELHDALAKLDEEFSL